MDTTTNDRKIVKQVILKYARFCPSYGHIVLAFQPETYGKATMF